MGDDYLQIIDHFASKNVLVIGDSILDIYLTGDSSRLSPEAPVPVVDILIKHHLPGGACNTALNLQSLHGNVSYCSVLGYDDHASKIVEALDEHGVNHDLLILHPERTTITKTRVIAGTQDLVRLDEGTETPIDPATERALIAGLGEIFPRFDAVIISDYNKGVLTRPLVAELSRLRRIYDTFVAVDSKRLEFFAVLQPSFVKPNYQEALALLKIRCDKKHRIEHLKLFGDVLYAKANAQVCAVTLDEDGVLIFEKNHFAGYTAAPPVTSPSVAGAGDTFVSVFTLGLISGGGTKKVTDLAVAAASIVVSKTSTARCHHFELKHYFRLKGKLISGLDELRELCAMYHKIGKRIVFTNGCFDILHSGHVAYLHQAKQLGDILIVGVNQDESIRRLKGDERPINPLKDRLEVLMGLAAVDYAIAFGEVDDDTPIPLIEAAQPDIFVKGGDYTVAELPEAATVLRNNGDIIFLPYMPDHSTTGIIKRINGALRTAE